MGQLQRSVISNAVNPGGPAVAVVSAKAGRVPAPLDITITNPDTVQHIVDFFDGVVSTAPIFTIYVPSDGTVGGGANTYSFERDGLPALSQYITPGNALTAASRDAVGGGGLIFWTDFNRL